jgi:hypothetical protein
VKQKKKIKLEPIIHKFIDIKPIIISEEENEKLEKFIETLTRRIPASEATIKEIKYKFLKKVTGICTHCSKLAEYQVNYDCNGASLVQRYCSSCLEEEKNKGNIERDY